MKRILTVETHLHRTAASAFIILLAACAPHTLQIFIDPATTPTATAEIPQYPSATEETTITATPAEPAPTATLAQPPAPDKSGWLLVETEQGLWMARPDGGKSLLRIPGKVIIPGQLSDAISPSGGLLAYITTSDPSRTPFPFGSYPELKLHIISLPDGRQLAEIPLTSPATEPDPDSTSEIQRAMIEQASFAWSPDGMRLAFIGAQEGPSADLYEYYPESGEVVRLTDGPDQAYRPVWSPGGEWIVHGAAERFSRVAGFGIDVSGFYAARADGSGVFSLYDVAAESGDEAVIGWLDGQTLVARSWLYTCGPSNVRLVDLAEQQVELAFEGCISGAAVGSGTVLFSQSSNDAAFDADARLGIYRLTASDRTPRMISGENTLEIEWEEGIGAFLARPWGTRLLEVSTAGEIRELPATAYIIPTVSPNGRWWAYISEWTYHRTDGIFAGGYGTELRQIFDGEVAGNGMIFSPDGDSLYFVAKGGGLYRARAPEWAPILLATGLTPAYGWTDMAWWEE